MLVRDNLSIELFVRSLLPQGAQHRQEAVIERLERMEREELLDDFSIVVWGNQIARESTAAKSEKGQFILNRVAEFQQWALNNNVSLDAFYQTREVGPEPGDEYRAIVLPVMGLAEYRDGELTQVAPCTNGDDVYTIMDHLDEIARSDASPFEDGLCSEQIV